MVEDMLAYRGIFVTYKTVREWAEKFGRAYADTIRRRVPRLDDKWHLDERVVSIKGEHHILWRAGDQHGFAPNILVQKLRNTMADKRFKSPRHLQRFASIHEPIYNLHYHPRNKSSATDHRKFRQAATSIWLEIWMIKSSMPENWPKSG